jgi:hypothetical protein
MFSQTPIPKITPVNPDSHKQPTQIDKINANIGLKTYMTNIYKRSGVAFGGSLITSMLAPSVVETLGIVDVAHVLWVANIPLSFYLIWKISIVGKDETFFYRWRHVTSFQQKTRSEVCAYPANV